jgi:hypothetical protein
MQNQSYRKYITERETLFVQKFKTRIHMMQKEQNGKNGASLKDEILREVNKSKEPPKEKEEKSFTKDLLSHTGVRILIGTAVVIGIIYLSSHFMNHSAESVRAYKNLRRAMREG